MTAKKNRNDVRARSRELPASQFAPITHHQDKRKNINKNNELGNLLQSNLVAKNDGGLQRIDSV